MDIEKYISLKDKQRRGQLTKDEQKTWQQWSESADATALSQLEQLADRYTHAYEPDVEAGLLRLKARMQTAQATTVANTQLRVVTRRRWLAVAAAVFLLAVGMVAIRGIVQTKPAVVVIATEAAEQRNLTLTDGSKVQLNANSTISLPETFKNAAKRAVVLRGEAYFKVQPNAQQPFEIAAEAVTITVVGTAFNVRAYPNESTVEVEVVEGTVKMTIGAQQIILKAKQKGIYNSENNQLFLQESPQLNAQAWRTHLLRFNNAPLAEVVQALSRYHRVRIDLANDTLQKCAFTGNFSKTRLDDALKTLKIIMSLQWEKPATDHYIIRNGVCQ
ncbi:MAG: FecR family protein [Saprospiraceae bacterium]